MKKLFALLLLAPLLGACASTPFGQELKNVFSAATNASVPVSFVIAAENTYDAVEKTAANYINFCTANRANPACMNFIAIRDNKLAPAIRSGRLARRNLSNFMDANPGALGPAGLYNALQAAVSTLQGVMTQYNIGGAK